MSWRPTPLYPLRSLPGAFVKDEGANPFGSWRDRPGGLESLAAELLQQVPGAFCVVAEESFAPPGAPRTDPAAISLDEAVRLALEVLKSDGILLSTFGAAGYAAAQQMSRSGSEAVVIVNPSSALLQIDLFRPPRESARLGGLITPR